MTQLAIHISTIKTKSISLKHFIIAYM